MIKTLTLAGIRLYQRYLSPLKGFACAYRVHTGRRSCSHFGLHAIRRHGVIAGAELLRNRMALCSDCHDERRALSAHRRAELGSCDPPCDLPCDGPDLKCAGELCDCLDCASCDWGRRSKERHPTRAQRQEARRRVREARQRATADPR